MAEQIAFNLESVAPVFAVADLKRALDFYTGKLLFNSDFEWSDGDDEPVRYAVLEQGKTELHLSQADQPRERRAYFIVSNVKGFYDAVKAKGATITSDLMDYPWQMREFEVTDPDGNRMIFGENVACAS